MASLRYMPMFVDNVIDEIQLQKDYLGKQVINTIYFGGGTPSLLSTADLNRIYEELDQQFNIDENAEITLEANPDDISKGWIKEIKNTTVNRLSMGVQSFHSDDLKYLQRIHSAQEAESAIKLIQEGGMLNLNIDLIYGIPGLTEDKWEQNLNKFFALDIPHLSAYALTVEEKTPLHVNIEKGKSQSPDETDTVAHFKSLISLTQDHGYIHYEISNFAREGHYSRHNSIYWTGGHYLGLGPSAHSFNGHSRRWNKASTRTWLDLKDYYSESFEEEVLTDEQRYNEYVMTSLRTMWGCDIEQVKQEFGDSFKEHLLHEASPHIESGKIVIKNGRFYLSNKGKLYADGIASDLFM